MDSWKPSGTFEVHIEVQEEFVEDLTIIIKEVEGRGFGRNKTPIVCHVDRIIERGMVSTKGKEKRHDESETKNDKPTVVYINCKSCSNCA